MISRKSLYIEPGKNKLRTDSVFTPDYKWSIQKGYEEYEYGFIIVKTVPYGSLLWKGMFLSDKFEHVIFFREHYVLVVYRHFATLYDYEHQLVIERTNSHLLLDRMISYNSNEQLIIETKFNGNKYYLSKDIDFFLLLTLIELIGIGLISDVGKWSNFLTGDLHDPRLLILIRLFYDDYTIETGIFFNICHSDKLSRYINNFV